MKTSPFESLLLGIGVGLGISTVLYRQLDPASLTDPLRLVAFGLLCAAFVCRQNRTRVRRG